MDSRYLTGIPGTLGVVSFSNEEHSLALQRTLGAEEFFALAGTRTTKDRVDQRRRRGLAPTMEPTEPAPIVVADAISRIEALL